MQQAAARCRGLGYVLLEVFGMWMVGGDNDTEVNKGWFEMK